MDYFLSEEQQMIVDIAKQITDERIIPARAELDEKHEFPRQILEEMAGAEGDSARGARSGSCHASSKSSTVGGGAPPASSAWYCSATQRLPNEL